MRTDKLAAPISAAPSLMTYTHILQPHPASRAGGVDAIQVEIVVLPAGALRLAYVLTGDLAGMRIPEAQAASRVDGLWQHSCFEVFVGTTNGPAYREFNFSPSGQWQAYAFTVYRVGDLLASATNPAIECLIEPGCLTLHATLQPDDLPRGAGLSSPLRLGLTAVVETTDGALSYWALRHAPGKPDFHHPDTFALEINS
ncbi:MAG: DOMON-like domain-containing protein [Pseudomonadota bacterium]|nr:DOMON-like domain-containing protein [Pseudomonadota bacterium]